MVSSGDSSNSLPSSLSIDDEKFLRLVEILRGYRKTLVAFSGGVDSSFLLRVCHDVLGENAVGVLAHSESLDRNEYAAARRVAEAMGIAIRVIETHEYDNEAYRRNDPDRCFHCKNELFESLRRIAAAEGFSHVLDGSNLDDLGDYRPGRRARDEQGVVSPLQEARLTKAEIRRFSRQLGLPTWDKPAAPCLSSRIPYGSEVTSEKLRQIEAAEAGLRELGFPVVRVRHHGEVARLEIPAADFSNLLRPHVISEALRRVREAGFRYVALDLQGYRSGSLNEVLPAASSSGTPAGVVPLSEIRRLS